MRTSPAAGSQTAVSAPALVPAGAAGARARRGAPFAQARRLVVVAASVAVSVSVSFWPALAGIWLVVTVGACAAVPVAIAAVGRRRGWTLLPAAAVSGLGLVLTVVVVVVARDVLGTHGVVAGVARDLAAVPAGLRDGALLLLEYLPPAPDRSRLLLLPAALTWLAAWSGAELVTRTDSRLLPAAPGLSVWVLVLALSVPGDDRHLLAAATVLAGAALLAAFRRRMDGSRRGADPHDARWRVPAADVGDSVGADAARDRGRLGGWCFSLQLS